MAPPTQQLLRRRVSWPRDVALCVTVGVAGFGAAPLLGHPGLALPALVGGVLVAVATSVHGALAAARHQLADRLVEALAPGLGMRIPDRRAVTLRGWTLGWPGAPRRVRLRYAPGVDDTDPTWRADLAKAVGRRLLAEYQVTRHDRRRCRLRLRKVPPTKTRAIPAVQARAERTVVELLGPTASVAKVEWSGEDMVALDVKHEAGARLAAPQYRHRIERVVSTMLPGRWRARWELVDDRVRFEVRPALPKLVEHPAPDLSTETRYQLPMAVGEDGEVISWNLLGLGPHLMVVGRTGVGKCCAVDTPVPTPTGWTTMGELRDGDPVFDEAGQPCTVVTAHPIRYDRPPLL
jgi:hypothetical protein